MLTTNLMLTALLLTSGSAFAEFSLQGYGFAKLSYLETSRAFDQDYKPVNVLSTNGQSDRAKNLIETSRGQFTVKHSRFGLNVDNKEFGLKAKFEFDLDGETGNTVGVTNSGLGIIRVRQANISYQVNEGGVITAGKKWDLFSPLQPHSYQVTTIQFWAGNTGFLTDGADYIQKLGDASFGVELKNAGTGSDNATTKLSRPTAVVRGDYKFTNQLLGLSLLSGELKYASQDVSATPTDKDREIQGLNVYYNGKFFGEKTDVIGEYTLGKNLGAGVIGALAQAPKQTSTNMAAEFGGNESDWYISVKHKWERFALYGGYGQAKFFNMSAAAMGNSRSNLASNSLARLGYERTLAENIMLYLELASVSSSYWENDSQLKTYSGYYADLGLMAKF